MHLPSLAQRLTSERNQAAAATHNNTHRFSGRTGIPIPAELKKILVDEVLDDAPCLISGEFEHLADFVHVDLS